MSISVNTLEDEQLIAVETASWQAEVVLSNNANMIRLRHLESGLDILRTPETLELLRKQPEHYGMPLLFPPGRIDGGKFRWNGREYTFPLNEPEKNCNLHGLILGYPWILSRKTETGSDAIISMEYHFGPDHPNYPGFPHEFRLELTYRFTPDAVLQETEVTNLGNAAMPFGIGYHTAFNLASAQCRIMATTADQRWEMSDPRRLPTRRLVALNEHERFNIPGGREVGKTAVSMLCPVENREGLRGGVLTLSDNTPRIIYEIDEKYHFWALWNDGGNKNFFCLEPLTCLSNAPNLRLSENASGLIRLTTGDTINFKTAIKIQL